MAENIGAPEILRDTELEQKMLEAVIADRNAQPRSQQLQVGPSEVGGCRELLRAGLFESDTVAEPETSWATAAHAGTVFGADLERIFGERLGALEQQRITATFGMFGLQISGGADLIFVDGDIIGDLKSNADIGGLLYDLKRDAAAIETLMSIHREGLLFRKNIETPDGGYELTQVFVDKISKLHYYVQIAIYVMGAMQQGVIGENGEGRLIFYDRAGNYQDFIAVRVPFEQIVLFYEIAQLRIGQVLQGQQAYASTGGNPAVIAHLRDKSPSYCFSPKVMCPRRMHCWAGSDWTANNQVSDPEFITLKERYKTGRDLEKLAAGMKKAARDELKQHEVEGMFPDGSMLTWAKNGAINLVETTVTKPQPQAVLDQFIAAPDLQGEIDAAQQRAATIQPVADTEAPASDTTAAVVDTEAPVSDTPKLTREQRYKMLANTGAPIVRRMANEMTGIELKGLRKDDAIDAILKHEYPESAPVAEEAASPEDASSEEITIPEGHSHDDVPHEDVVRDEGESTQVDQPEHGPGYGRVIFEPSEPEGNVPLPGDQGMPHDEQEEARRKLARGPHIAPLLDKPAPEPTVAPKLLPDGRPYVPMKNEDPDRPGLFLDGMGNLDRLRQMQYNNDPVWREGLLRQRSLYEGRIPTAAQGAQEEI